MLVHIVCWKYKEVISEDERETHRVRLRELKNVIPEVIDIEVGADVLHLTRSYDTGLVAIFRNLEGLVAYTVHPAHEEVANLGKQLAEHVVSVDFMRER
jgi:hypothetical protein